jgi:MFS family permease
LVRGYRERPQPDALRLRRIRDAVLRRDVLVVTLPWFVIYMLLGTAFIFLADAASAVGFPVFLLALLIGGGGLILLLTQPFFGRMADRFGRFRLMTVGTLGFVGVLTFGSLIATFGARPILLAAIGLCVVPALAYGPAALAALADLSRSISRGTTMSVYSLTISLGMFVGLFGSTALYGRYHAAGLDLFFGLIATGLVVLTAIRWSDLRTGRGAVAVGGTQTGVPTVAPITTPARSADAGGAGTPPAH